MGYSIVLFCACVVVMPLAVQCAEAVRQSRKFLVPKLDIAALLARNKKRDPAAKPINAPGLLANQQKFLKEPDALVQVRRTPSGRPPLLLQALPLYVLHSQVGAGSPSGLSASITPNSSDKSDFSAVSDLSSPGSALVAASPEALGSPLLKVATVDIAEMLRTSPAMPPIKKKHSSDGFALPAAAVSARKSRSQSLEVGAGSDKEASPDSSDKETSPIEVQEDFLDPIDVHEMTRKDYEVVRTQVPREIEDPTPLPVVLSQKWTPLMEAAWEGDIDAIKTMDFTFKDVKEWHTHGPRGEKTHALALVRKGRDEIATELEKNPIFYLHDCDDLIEHSIRDKKLSEELKNVFTALARNLERRIELEEVSMQEHIKQECAEHERTGQKYTGGKFEQEYMARIRALEAIFSEIKKVLTFNEVLKNKALRIFYKKYQEYNIWLGEYDEILKIFAQKARG